MSTDTARYPDTSAGALEALAVYLDGWDGAVDSSSAIADPYFSGVWKIDIVSGDLAGHYAIVFLAGYPDAFGTAQPSTVVELFDTVD